MGVSIRRPAFYFPDSLQIISFSQFAFYFPLSEMVIYDKTTLSFSCWENIAELFRIILESRGGV